MSFLICGKSNLYCETLYHSHSDWEIVCNIEGKGYAILVDKKIETTDRTVFCIPPNFKHWSGSDDGIRDMWLWCTDFPMMSTSEITVLEDDAERSIYSIMSILHSIQYGNKYENSATKSAVTESLLDALRQLILSKITKTKTDPRVDNVINEIVKNFHEYDFSIEECLASFGYCPDYMRRLFKAQTGMNPSEYLTDMRIKMAKKLLLTQHISGYTLSQISSIIGFSDVCYFARIFKKITGMTPMNYAKNFSNNNSQQKNDEKIDMHPESV